LAPLGFWRPQIAANKSFPQIIKATSKIALTTIGKYSDCLIRQPGGLGNILGFLFPAPIGFGFICGAKFVAIFLLKIIYIKQHFYSKIFCIGKLKKDIGGA
jgi:hypothetical protein